MCLRVYVFMLACLFIWYCILFWWGIDLFLIWVMKNKQIRVRCWIDIDGVKFFGPGRAELLELIDQEGSIAKAAKRMGMSYKKAWDMVDEMNTRGRKPFVISRKGGDKGGGASLTETGRMVVDQYRALMAKLDAVAEKNTAILNLI